jgi:hypothetical protein
LAYLGPTHPDTLRTQSSLANCYRIIGDLHKSLRVHTDTFRLRKKILGPTNSKTLASKKNINVTTGMIKRSY